LIADSLYNRTMFLPALTRLGGFDTPPVDGFGLLPIQAVAKLEQRGASSQNRTWATGGW